jgi:hypothetical protein
MLTTSLEILVISLSSGKILFIYLQYYVGKQLFKVLIWWPKHCQDFSKCLLLKYQQVIILASGTFG